MNIKLGLEIAIAITALISFIYRITQLESNIYKAIDEKVDIIHQRLNLLESRLEIHKTAYVGDKEHQDYLINALNETIKHKFQRCMNEIKQLEKDFKKEE
mgnify:CR=1 FL=1